LVENHPHFNDLCADVIETLEHSGYFNKVQVMQQ
jgi:lipoyl(octanoyl) transferase